MRTSPYKLHDWLEWKIPLGVQPPDCGHHHARAKMPKGELWLRCVVVLQGAGALWVLFNALVATEMSALLGVGLGLFAAAAAGAAIGLGKRWKNAFRLSLGLNAIVVVVGVWLLFLAKDAPWLGLAHVLAGATLLLGLWAGRGAASLVS